MSCNCKTLISSKGNHATAWQFFLIWNNYHHLTWMNPDVHYFNLQWVIIYLLLLILSLTLQHMKSFRERNKILNIFTKQNNILKLFNPTEIRKIYWVSIKYWMIHNECIFFIGRFLEFFFHWHNSSTIKDPLISLDIPQWL